MMPHAKAIRRISGGRRRTLVGTLTSEDPNTGNTQVYTLASGEQDNNTFSISGSRSLNDGMFNFDAKNTYNVQATRIDKVGESDSKDFTITITEEKLLTFRIFLPLFNNN